MKIRSRELRHVRAGDLTTDIRNWRDHPEIQRDALEGIVDTVGMVSPLMARETDAGLVLIDGHLRAGLDPDAIVPVVVVDLDEDEAAAVMATYDPLADMARPDLVKLSGLVSELQTMDLPDVAPFLDVADTVQPALFAAETTGAHYSEPDQPDYSRRNAFILPFSRQAEVRVWPIWISEEQFESFIAEARDISHRLGFGDDAAALVMHALEVAYDSLNEHADPLPGR